MNEKRTATLPPLRITPRLETALMRLASREDRSLSEYLNLVLQRHVFGHASSVGQDSCECEPNNASQRIARKA